MLLVEPFIVLFFRDDFPAEAFGPCYQLRIALKGELSDNFAGLVVDDPAFIEHTALDDQSAVDLIQFFRGYFFYDLVIFHTCFLLICCVMR